MLCMELCVLLIGTNQHSLGSNPRHLGPNSDTCPLGHQTKKEDSVMLLSRMYKNCDKTHTLKNNENSNNIDNKTLKAL